MECFQVRYNSRVVIYERKLFIRLATGVHLQWPSCKVFVNLLNLFELKFYCQDKFCRLMSKLQLRYVPRCLPKICEDILLH